MHKILLPYIIHPQRIPRAIVSRILVIENRDFNLMDLPIIGRNGRN